MKPVNIEVICNMKTPIMLGAPFIAGDGLLAHLEMREHFGEAYAFLPAKQVIPIIPELYLERWNGIYRASVSIFEDPFMTTTTIYKRFPQGEIANTRDIKKYIDISRGSYKNYAMEMPLVVTKRVTFYFRGDIERLFYLFKHLKFIGKKTVIGYGEIKEISIQEIDKDYSLIKDDLAMRAIPKHLLKSCEQTAYLAFKPPFWDRKNVTECCVPLTRVVS